MNVGTVTGWTEERIEHLKKLWKEGYSASQCAKMLGGVSRSAVIGKVHRLGLDARAVVVRKPQDSSVAAKVQAARQKKVHQRLQKERPVSVRVARMKAAPEPDPVDETLLHHPVWDALPGTTPVALVDLTNETCRWPIGDPKQPGFGFCGCPPVEGSSYCATHKARSIGAGSSAERAAAKHLRIISHLETRARAA